MHFVSAVAPPPDHKEAARWFIFKNDELLVQRTGNTVHIPHVRNVSELPVTPLRTQYLGTSDGIHCYSAEIDSQDSSLPEDLTFQTLRVLFSSLSEQMFWIAAQAYQIMNWDRTHQYCGRCGHATESLSDERAKTCPQCNLTQYPRLSPAIIVAVIRDHQLLLARAARFPKELYSVIAGFVEPGETFEECIRREVREEVGIEVKNMQYFGSQPWPFPHSLMVGFTAQYAGGEIAVDHTEILQAGWFSVDNLPNIPGKISIARRLIDWFIEKHTPTLADP